MAVARELRAPALPGERFHGTRFGRSHHAPAVSQPSPDSLEESLVAAAITGERAARDTLVRSYASAVQSGVAVALRPWFNLPLSPEDLRQEAWAHIFAHDSRVLRQWDKGLGPLAAYLKVVSRNCASDILRTKKKNPAGLELAGGEEAAELSPSAEDLEALMLRRDILRRVEAEIYATGSERDLRLYQRLIRDDLDTAVVAAEEACSEAALNMWKHRLRSRLSRWASQLMKEWR